MKQRKNREIRVYCTEETYNQIKQKADKLNMKLSAYLKWLGLHATLEIKENKEN